MRFTIYLIALVVSFIASLFTAGCIDQIEYRGFHPRWSHAINDLRSLRATITGVTEEYPAITDARAINRWLAKSDDLTNEVAAQISFDAVLDPWGRPYVFAERGTSSDMTWDRVHVYSLGKDGQTKTSGNDPDDINTWDEESHDHYIRLDNQATVQRHLKRLAWIFPVFSVCAMAIVRMTRSKPTPNTDADADATESSEGRHR